MYHEHIYCAFLFLRGIIVSNIDNLKTLLVTALGRKNTNVLAIEDTSLTMTRQRQKGNYLADVLILL